MELYFEGMASAAKFKREYVFPTVIEYKNIWWKSVDVLQMVDGVEVATEATFPRKL